MDAGLERLVDGANPVRGGKQRSVVILQNLDEHRYRSVHLHIGLGPLRKDHIGLIEEHAIPQVSKLEYVLQ